MPGLESKDPQKSKIYIIVNWPSLFANFLFATNRHLNKGHCFSSIPFVIQHSIRLQRMCVYVCVCACVSSYYFYYFVSFKCLTLCGSSRTDEKNARGSKTKNDLFFFYFCLHLASVHFELLWSNWHFDEEIERRINRRKKKLTCVRPSN